MGANATAARPPQHGIFNGETAEAVFLADRGLGYGDGVFETIRVNDGRLTLWEGHLARLQRGLERLAIAVNPATFEVLASEARELAARPGVGLLRLAMTRGSGGRGYRPPAEISPSRILLAFPEPEFPVTSYREGVRVRVCDLRLAEQPRLAGIKHLNRLEQVLARMEWSDPEIAEGLLLDAAGHVIEATSMNLFAALGGRLCTPTLEACGVAGVMREHLLTEFAARGVRVAIAPLDLDELHRAEEMFLCNSVAGVWAVRECGEHRYAPGGFGRLAQKIAAAAIGTPEPS